MTAAGVVVLRQKDPWCVVSRNGTDAPSSLVQGYLSVHITSFSYIHPSRPTGESVRPYPSVCGRVDCCVR